MIFWLLLDSFESWSEFEFLLQPEAAYPAWKACIFQTLLMKRENVQDRMNKKFTIKEKNKLSHGIRCISIDVYKR